MKKAKIMLASLLVLVAVGGALAFKAQNFTQKHVYCAEQQQDLCTITYTSANLVAGDPVTTLFCTDDAASTCNIAAPITVYSAGN
jgi:hypothetical protein